MEYPKDISYRFSVEYTLDSTLVSDRSCHSFERPAKFSIIYIIILCLLFLYWGGSTSFFLLSIMCFATLLVTYRKLVKRCNEAVARIPYLHKETDLHDLILFSDQIVVTNGDLRFDYADVSYIKESDLGYFLGLKYNSGLYFPKNVTCHFGDPDFQAFLLNACPNLKRKKIIRISKYRKICKFTVFIPLIFAVLSLANYLLWLFLFYSYT